ncbi:MAG TPA: sporulation integral membrane protein YlbJ [Limnochordales bacterium]
MPQTTRSALPIYGMAAVASLLTAMILLFPEASFSASVAGLRLWLEVVFPALLPFFVMAELMMGLGVIHCIGVLLEPLMRPLFRLPGAGAFAVAIGLAAGYPLGAKVAGDLRRAGLCTGPEGERLVSFANTADPLFLAGGVAVGMFALPELAGPLAFGHYAGVFGVGLLMRFHARGGAETVERRQDGPLLRRALEALRSARRRDGRPIGQLFGDAVRNSMNSLLFVGGVIMMFSVFLEVLTIAGVVPLAARLLAEALEYFQIHPSIADALVRGTFEITIGAQAASSAAAPLMEKAVAASAIIAWSGLSVHAQVAALLHGTDIRLGPYIAARALHSLLAAACTWVLLGPAHGLWQAAHWPVLAPAWAVQPLSFGARLFHSTATATQMALGMLAVVGATAAMRRLAVFWARIR